jgi:hypothetical protein
MNDTVIMILGLCAVAIVGIIAAAVLIWKGRL